MIFIPFLLYRFGERLNYNAFIAKMQGDKIKIYKNLAKTY